MEYGFLHYLQRSSHILLGVCNAGPQESQFFSREGEQGQWDRLEEQLGGPSVELLTELPCRKEAWQRWKWG